MAEVLDHLSRAGALFFSDLCTATGRLPTEVAEALWEGVTRGMVTSDGFAAVRVLLGGRYRSSAGSPTGRYGTRRFGRALSNGPRPSPTLAGGRWSMLRALPPETCEPDELAEAVAAQLLERWGVVVRELYAREPFGIAWRDVLWALRRFEARGIVRGGRFVAGLIGEQFALPEALEQLRGVASREPSGVAIRLCATDPLNLTGILVPGPRIPAVRGRFITLRDGVPTESTERRAGAAQTA
jgi:ATP-dependent Lhr-like helicase